jgi:hypothetical protein
MSRLTLSVQDIGSSTLIPFSAQQLTPLKALLEELLWGQAASFVSMLLQGLRQMGGNAHIAKRIIGTLSGHAPGRVALRDACADWQAEVQRQAPEPGNKASLQWAVSRLWQLGKQSSRHIALRSPCRAVRSCFFCWHSYLCPIRGLGIPAP